MPRQIVISRDSVEYVKATVTADVTLDATVTVAIAITAPGGTPSWLAAEWTGDESTTRTARTTSAVTFSTANYPLSGYIVRVKLTDSPETPIVNAGSLTIIP